MIQNQFTNFQQRDFNPEINKILGSAAASPPVDNPSTIKSIKPFVKIPKEIDEKNLSAGATKLYVHLLVLQDRYKLNGEAFYHTLQQLVDELGHAKGSIEKWQKELIAKNLISIELKHFRNGDKISENRRTYYTIL